MITNFAKIEGLFGNKKALLVILFFLLSFQLAYSFLYPTHGPRGKAWLSLPDLISHEKSPLDTSEGSLITRAYVILDNYYVNADGGQYLILANNFPNHYVGNNPVILDRPLYSFLIATVAFLPRLFFDSYATLFASAVFLNFILGFFSVTLFYYLCEKLINSRVAILSSLLLLFSPSFHIWMVQIMPEMLTNFMIIATLFLLYEYVKNPSPLKLITFSLIVGTFMLGKMLFALSIFILISAFYFRRLKEGILFLIIHLIPLALWYLFVTKGLRMPFFVNEVTDYGVGIWLFNIFKWPWQKTAETFLAVLPQFISIVIYGFLLLPIIFSIIGFKKITIRKGKFFIISFVLSFLILIFITNLYFPRYGFWIYPVVYPLAVLGIERVAEFLKKYKDWYARAFYLIAYLSIISISNSDFYRIIYYG
ncbi:MAG: glycosyltransferase family 39 protein [Candidatus Nealsonbacteria bacterium]|nr:glycosyltransferase family 39 protein [Candidatus Nealsonbacteria bacterium]